MSGLHQAYGKGRDEQLGLQNAVVRNNFHLQAPWVRKLADRGLHHRDAPGSRSSDDVSAAAADLSDALLGCRKFTA